jgi:1,2-diacylglycerol 3-alpha-glucosyltransferase
MTTKIGLIFASYGPYHLARVQGVIDSSYFNDCKIVAIELARAQTEYPWLTQVENLPFSFVSVISDRPLEQVNPIRLLLKLKQTLNKIDPDILVISGYSGLSMLFALVWSRWHHKPTVLLSDSTKNDFARSAWKERLKGLLISQYQAALVGGQPQKLYITGLGMSEKLISLGFDVVGNYAFYPTHIRTLARPLEQPYFLSINRFIQKKNLPFLINTYATYRQTVGKMSWDLVLCGDGELRSQLEHQIHTLGLENYVHLPGFLQQNELLPYFAHANCFIHASTHEQWGLVVNEAMAAGLPVLLSNRCGCFEDLLLEGFNGFGFDPEDHQQLADLMIKISSGSVDLEVMGKASLQHIQKYSPDYFAKGLKQAIENALAKC